MIPDDALIIDLNLPTRVRFALRRAGYLTAGQARQASDNELTGIRNFRSVSLQALRSLLSKTLETPPNPPVKPDIERCPFCATLRTFGVESNDNRWAIVCDNCRSRGPWANDRSLAIDNWNLRRLYNNSHGGNMRIVRGHSGTEDKGLWIRTLRITPRLLLDMFMTGKRNYEVFKDPVPEDARLMDVYVDTNSGMSNPTIALMFETEQSPDRFPPECKPEMRSIPDGS